MLMSMGRWVGLASLIWVIVLAVFLIAPLFPKLWFSDVWPTTLLGLAIADIVAIGLATKAALSVNRLWWWSVGGGVVVCILLLGSIAG
ncbi:hypothetical protein GCM10011585_31120 [Edaphobacter dinghuensis]|uniref:Uncharacterized protein n=1 Tax=Edaphobacter dinghuensis TaxID=1560005 RepID=A0A917M8U8_9BACT|nr:hypothetical protein GCM10011585_31120 [Edaphobacter dinghuensis]